MNEIEQFLHELLTI